jgi:exosortase
MEMDLRAGKILQGNVSARTYRMSFPSPIQQAEYGKTGTAATPVAQPRAAAVAAQSPVDEGLIAGFLRRVAQWVSDLRSPEEWGPWATIAVLSAGLIYSYGPSLANLPSSWNNPQYQHGWIVPALSVVLLIWWRQPITAITPSARLAGLSLLAMSLVVRLGFAYFRVKTFDMYTFVPALAGVFLMAGGWGVFRWAWVPIALLIFMYPLPEGHQRYLTGPLQTFNTVVATFLLQTLGFDAFRDGNLIRLGDEHVMNVVDACAGLKMLTIFVWLAAVVIAVAGLPWWENLLIAISAIPMAILANTLRITTAGMLYGVSAEMAEGFHDSTPAAILMMGAAVGFILLEMKLLSYVIVTDDFTPARLPAAAAGGPRPAATGPRPGSFPLIPGANRPGGNPGTDRTMR